MMKEWTAMADDFPLSDTVSFQTTLGWYDLIVTTAHIPAESGATHQPRYRTVADLHAPHTEEGTATLLEGLVREYTDGAAARAGHAELLRLVEERQVPLPIPDVVTAERKLRG
jgi:hypothetical protein